MSDTLIIKLSDDLSGINPATIGGKAFALATLYQRKFPVPRGFVITTHAFDRFLRSIGKGHEGNLSQTSLQKNSFKTESSGIQEKIAFGNIPPDLADAIECSLNVLDTPYVAVRSSATMEDGERFSYAGQFESFLNVPRERVLPQVKMCWGSLFTPRAIAYSQNGIYGGKMAVLVQEMIKADLSGVCFSINPVDGDTNTIIMESVLGSGEALVQGMATPDRYLVSKTPVAIRERHFVSENAMPDSIVEETARTVMEIENYYQKPVDMEFAVKDGRLYVLQARPVTASARA